METIPLCLLINKPDVFSLTQHRLCCVVLDRIGVVCLSQEFLEYKVIFFLLLFYLKSVRFRDPLMKAIVEI